MPRKSQKTNATCAAKNTPKDIPSQQTPPNVEYGQFFSFTAQYSIDVVHRKGDKK